MRRSPLCPTSPRPAHVQRSLSLCYLLLCFPISFLLLAAISIQLLSSLLHHPLRTLLFLLFCLRLSAGYFLKLFLCLFLLFLLAFLFDFLVLKIQLFLFLRLFILL